MKTTFQALGNPIPKQRPRFVRFSRGGGRTYTPEPTVRYEKLIGDCAIIMRPANWPQNGKYSVKVEAYFKDARRRDIDNVAKSVLDGLNGILWADDNQVAELNATKTIDRDNPRTVVTVEVWS